MRKQKTNRIHFLICQMNKFTKFNNTIQFHIEIDSIGCIIKNCCSMNLNSIIVIIFNFLCPTDSYCIVFSGTSLKLSF